MGVSWADLDERTRERLLEENPELAAEFAPKQKAAGVAREPVDPAVQEVLDQIARLKEVTLNLRAQAGLVTAEARLVGARGQLELARRKQHQRTPRSHGSGSGGRRRGRHGRRHGFWTTFLVLFVVALIVLAVL